jgi:hypothetical protein
VSSGLIVMVLMITMAIHPIRLLHDLPHPNLTGRRVSQAATER